MILSEKKAHTDADHGLELSSRNRLNASGVKEVFNFDDSSIVADTEKGVLTIKGSELHIDKLNLEMGELSVNGSIDGLLYSDNHHVGRTSLLQKLFK